VRVFARSQAVIDRMPAGMRGWLAAGLDRHPLLDLAADELG